MGEKKEMSQKFPGFVVKGTTVPGSLAAQARFLQRVPRISLIQSAGKSKLTSQQCMAQFMVYRYLNYSAPR
jgi:hypothetical protein